MNSLRDHYAAAALAGLLASGERDGVHTAAFRHADAMVAAREEGREKKSTAKKKFVPPTIGQVKAYCEEKGHRIDALAFVSHYTANGWRVGGRSQMRCWKSAIVTWVKRNENESGKGTGRSTDSPARVKSQGGFEFTESVDFT